MDLVDFNDLNNASIVLRAMNNGCHLSLIQLSGMRHLGFTKQLQVRLLGVFWGVGFGCGEAFSGLLFFFGDGFI
jgi:hypothetical protein